MITCLALIGGIASYFFKPIPPTIRFLRTELTPQGEPVAVFQISNPTDLTYSYSADGNRPIYAGRREVPTGWEDVFLGWGGPSGSADLLPHTSTEIVVGNHVPLSKEKFKIGIVFDPGAAAAKKTTKPPRLRKLTSLVESIFKFQIRDDCTWSDSASFP